MPRGMDIMRQGIGIVGDAESDADHRSQDRNLLHLGTFPPSHWCGRLLPWEFSLLRSYTNSELSLLI